MDLKRIFSVFSRREKECDRGDLSIPETFRIRLIQLITQEFSVGSFYNAASPFWAEMRSDLLMLEGRLTLTDTQFAGSVAKEVGQYLQECPDERVLDFIELLFQTEAYRKAHGENENAMVQSISELLRLDDLAYALTPFVRHEEMRELYGRLCPALVLDTYPKVIRRENRFSHTEIVEPTIELLSDVGFATANAEFIEALEDYRRGEYGDCLTKCGSALESTMKILCDRRGWDYDQEDTASKLVLAVIEGAGLERFWQSALTAVPTIRNKLSKSHGAGVKFRQVAESEVQYAINATGSVILFLVRRCYGTETP